MMLVLDLTDAVLDQLDDVCQMHGLVNHTPPLTEEERETLYPKAIDILLNADLASPIVAEDRPLTGLVSALDNALNPNISTNLTRNMTPEEVRLALAKRDR